MLKTKDGKLLDVEVLNYQDVIKILENLLPNFAKVIIRSDIKTCSFYKANYAFGAEIIQNGEIYLPLANGESIAIHDEMLPENMVADLNFNPKFEDPLILVLNKKSELYYRPSIDRTMSHAVLEPGSIIGVPRATYIAEPGITFPTSSLCWELNAGAKFLFMLSKIADKSKYDKLSKSLNIKVHPSPSSENNWEIFRDIARQCNSSWKCSLLFFSRQWIEQVRDEANSALSLYLIHRHRSSYNIWHNRTVLWSTALNEIEKQKKLTLYAPYVLSTARQLFYIAAQSSVGFTPAISDDSAPIEFLQKIFENDYGLLGENQSSVIMEPSHINIENSEPIYYSLNYPIIAEYKPGTFKGKSQIALLYEVNRAINAYKACIIENNTINIPIDLFNIVVKTEFSFYHYSDDPANYKNIQNSSLVVEEDKRFLFQQKTSFAENSSFFKGCIKIVRKK